MRHLPVRAAIAFASLLAWNSSTDAQQPTPTRVDSLSTIVDGAAPAAPSRGLAGFLGIGKPFQRDTLFTWPGYEEPDEPEDPAEDRLASDRPDFTEASSTVGRRRVQLETGYTFLSDKTDGVRTNTHSYPEALLRVGMIADWFEFRIAQNFFTQTTSGDGPSTRDTGASDLYLGCKLFLTKQHRFLPEAALIIQGTVPSGAGLFTNGRGTYGANLCYGWDVIPDLITFAGSTQANRVFDETGTGHALMAQSFTVGYTLTKNLNAYTEWFGLFPVRAVDTGGGAKHYFDGGFQYFVTNNLAFDIRAGIRLSRVVTSDYFGGVGMVVRY